MIAKFQYRECKRYHSTNHCGEIVIVIILDESEYNELSYPNEFSYAIKLLSYFAEIGKYVKCRLNITLYQEKKVIKYYTIIPPNLIDDIIRFGKIGFSHPDDFRNGKDGIYDIIELDISKEILDELKKFFVAELGI